MPFIPDRSEAARARRLAAFADARVRGEAMPPTDADERMTDHLNTTLGPAFRAASAMPAGARRRTWEDLMQGPLTATTMTPMSAPVGQDRIGQGPGAQFAAWQSAVSLVVVLGFLVAIAGIAYQRIPGSGPDDNGPGAELGAQLPYQAYGQDIVYQGPNECVANERTYLTDDELLAEGMPAYVSPIDFQFTTVTPDVAASIRDVYFGYLRCWADSGIATPVTEATGENPSGANAVTYLSDRMRYTVMGWTGFDEEERAAVDAYYCAWDRTTFLTEFPIPLNGPNAFVVLPEATDVTVGMMVPTFRQDDVYRMSDGRYAAVIGSISSGAYLSWLGIESDLASPAAGANAEPLTVVIFSRFEGTYVIDQTLLISQTHDAEPEWPRLPFSCMKTDW
jgi:hypothetical protein